MGTPIGNFPPNATRMEPADIVGVGNNTDENPADSHDVPASAVRRCNADMDLESILNDLNLLTSGVKRLTVLNTGKIGVNNLAPAKDFDVIGEIRASVGILFGTDTAAANTLDDYEEGTWTCSIVGQTSTSTGIYTKIGDLVYVAVFFSCDTNVATTAASTLVSGFPFTASSSDDRAQLIFRVGTALDAVAGANGAPTISTTTGPTIVEIGPSSTTGSIRPVGGTLSNAFYRENIFNSTSAFYLAGVYKTA